MERKIRKVSFWFNPTQVKPRWDGEIWYDDGAHERRSKLTFEQIQECLDLINEQMQEA